MVVADVPEARDGKPPGTLCENSLTESGNSVYEWFVISCCKVHTVESAKKRVAKDIRSFVFVRPMLTEEEGFHIRCALRLPTNTCDPVRVLADLVTLGLEIHGFKQTRRSVQGSSIDIWCLETGFLRSALAFERCYISCTDLKVFVLVGLRVHMHNMLRTLNLF